MIRKYTFIISIFTILLSGGCVTSNSKKFGAETASSLKACMNRLTKAELAVQAGSPSMREPRDDGGEVWVYEYADQKTITTQDNIIHYEGQAYNFGGGGTQTHNYHFRVSIGFDSRGIMDDWRYNGNIAAFPNSPFRRLSTSAPSPPSLKELDDKLGASLSKVMNAVNLYKEDLYQQVGEPTSILPNNKMGGDTWRYLYDEGQTNSASYKSFYVDIQFNKFDEFTGYSYSGKRKFLRNIPFFDLQSPPEFNGFWVLVSDSEHNTRILFDRFPSSKSVNVKVVWTGDTDSLCGTAQGKGAVRFFNAADNELGCYIATFEKGRPVAAPDVMVNEDYNAHIPELSLGGVSWP